MYEFTQPHNDCCKAGADHRPLRPCQQNSLGTQSSNTVPSTCIDDTNTRIIRTGIDSLYLSYSGDLSEENHIRLKELKKLAQAQETSLSSLAQISLSEHLFEVKERGRHPFAYILVDNHYRIEVSSLAAKRLPLAHTQISSELLTQCGADLSVESLNSIVQSLGLVDGDPSVSRADLCVDFVTNFPLHQITDENWVTRAQNMNRYLDTRRFSGWSIGAGSIKARLYNKSLELQKKPRPYLHSLYEALGVNDNEQVWRLEFELRRETLRQLQVTSFTHLVSSLAGLWIYATHDWLRCCKPNDNDQTHTRWPTHSFWSVLQSADWRGDQTLKRVNVDKGRPPNDRTLFVNGLSGITSFMAREGITDPIEGPNAYLQAACQYHDNREHITGTDFFGYINEKVKAKARAFNSFRVMPEETAIHPADKAVATQYRKLSDGE